MMVRKSCIGALGQGITLTFLGLQSRFGDKTLGMRVMSLKTELQFYKTKVAFHWCFYAEDAGALQKCAS